MNLDRIQRWFGGSTGVLAGGRFVGSRVPRVGPARRGAAERRLTRLLELADVRVNGDRPWDLQVHDPRFFARVWQQESLGLGDSYVEGWWDCAAIDELTCRVLRADLPARMPPALPLILGRLRARLWNLQRGRGGRKVATLHYDAGNALFEAMLGPTMNYSCAYWRRAATLDEAQEHKMRLIARKLRLGPGDRLLDIGCGWGGLLRFVAEHYGCTGVGVTLSPEQQRYAADWCRGRPVEVLLADYRDPALARGPFTKVVSVGMFEHVGARNHRRMLDLAAGLLPEGGLFLLHTFGRSVDASLDVWVDRHVFPNSYLPTIEDIGRASHGRLVMEDWHNFGADYDRTLMAWQERFDRWASAQGPAMTPERRRAWRYYLLTFAGAFRARTRIQLWQVVFSRGGVPGGYQAPR
ncbi:MAG: cyclopropane fatty acyl phospholipid synthase [Verrucomicrobiota bacterium]